MIHHETTILLGCMVHLENRHDIISIPLLQYLFSPNCYQCDNCTIVEDQPPIQQFYNRQQIMDI